MYRADSRFTTDLGTAGSIRARARSRTAKAAIVVLAAGRAFAAQWPAWRTISAAPRAHAEPQPDSRSRPSAGALVLGAIVGTLVAGCTVVAAILAFDVNPAGPVVVVVAAITGGSLAVRRVPAVALKAAAVGLVVGGIAAILLWPFFDVR